MQIKKTVTVISLALFMLALLGVIIENQARRQAMLDFPPVGKRVNIGDRFIHLDCRGEGSPTVVFESGLDTMGSLSWAQVHNQVAKSTRACAYDRAGMMWSDPNFAIDNNMALSVANDLAKALSAASENPPFVMVGHSFGGPYTTVFTKTFADKVAGLVFVDTSHPDQVNIMSDFKEPWLNLVRYAVMDFFEFAWSAVGLTRVFAKLNTTRDTGQSQYDADAIDAFSSLSGEALTQESQFYDESLADAGTFRNFGDRPLIVIAAIANFNEIPDQELADYGLKREDVPEIIKRQVAMHTDKANWSTNSELIIEYNTEHYVQFAKPALVINAINKVVGQVRTLSTSTPSHQ